MNLNFLKKYRDRFSENDFWKKVKAYGRQAGLQVVYTALLMFYAYQRKETPSWARRIIIGAIGYFIAPIDALPDLSPIIGYTDDVAILSFGLVTVAAYINKEVKDKARKKLSDWFGDYRDDDLIEVDRQL